MGAVQQAEPEAQSHGLTELPPAYSTPAPGVTTSAPAVHEAPTASPAPAAAAPEIAQAQQPQVPQPVAHQQQQQQQPPQSQGIQPAVTSPGYMPDQKWAQPQAPGQYQPPLMQQQQQQQGAHGVIPLSALEPRPQWIDCPWCRQRTQTTVKQEGEGAQMVMGVVLCLFCICLACLPCMLHWFEETTWSCSNCKKVVATKTSDQPVLPKVPQESVMVPSQYANPNANVGYAGQGQQGPQQPGTGQKYS